MTVGLLNALYAFQGAFKSPAQLADEAAHIEIDVLGKPIGRQDQYAAAVGGFNFIEFMPRGGGVRVEPVIASADTFRRLQRSLIMFYTGQQRSADTVLSDQRDGTRMGRTTESLVELRDLAYELRENLTAGEVDRVGPMLHRSWELKRGLGGGVSNSGIDGFYAAATDAGATGGKILGAGAGGFLLLFAPAERQPAVRAALGSLREVPLRFSSRGTHIMVWDGN
ncbi:MAG TPA: hypothetical protein VG405_00335 [Solirubrobacteraceae bacterium]|nr:hypothetical protein [Solirubrobacteraceae bacterium]